MLFGNISKYKESEFRSIVVLLNDIVFLIGVEVIKSQKPIIFCKYI